ncbi:MAG TPA: hypothetical protein VGR16_11470 [Thermomicrobiales bacterium]|nr:hypothetical protein [Thermomicrobiales bacterium]
MFDQGPNRWKGFVLGLAGGVVGTVAMEGYWKAVTVALGADPRVATTDDGVDALKDVSLVGRQHMKEEGSTAAMGRIAFEQIAGKAPESDETKSVLSYEVHYAYGALQGGLYGAMTGDRGSRDVTDGALFGTALWLLGDEGAVSLLGLTEGPGSYPLKQHLARWGAHLVYGLATAATVKALRKAL